MKTAILRDEIKNQMNNKLRGLKKKFPELLDGSVTTTDVADLGDKLWMFNLSAPQDKWLSTLELMVKQVELLRRKGFGNKIVFPFAPMSPEYNADSTAIILADTSFVKTAKRYCRTWPKDLPNDTSRTLSPLRNFKRSSAG